MHAQNTKEPILNYLIKIIVIAFDAFAISWVSQFVLFGKPCFLFSASLITFVSISFTPIRLSLNIITLLIALLFPVSRTLQDGLLQWASVEILMTTNIEEALGFQESLPTGLILQAVGIAVVLLIFIIFNKRLNLALSNQNRKKFCVAAFILTPCFIISAYKTIYPRVIDMRQAYTDLTTNYQLPPPDFTVTPAHFKHKKYVVIIGESMRADMVSAYGFSLKTTPNIEAIPKQIISSFITPAPYTIVSVPRLLSIVHDDGKIEIQNNAVTLAKAAGFKTYWISSQGFTGQWQIGAKQLASYADQNFFSPMQIDDLLLPEIEKTLTINEPQVLFIHIIGSHENPCNRLGNYDNKYESNGSKILSCYLSSFNRTDEFIARIITMLKKYSANDYSLMYFADHGLNFVKDGNNYALKRDPNVKQSYQVPFFITSGTMTKTTIHKVLRSGSNLMNYFPTWLGVTTDKTPEGYDIFQAPSDNPMVMGYDEILHPYVSLKDGIKAEEIAKYVKKIDETVTK